MKPPPTTVEFNGEVLQAVFTTETDMQQFLPPTLEAVDGRRGFLKSYRLRRSSSDQIWPVPFAQYQQVCLTVLARESGTAGRALHRNLAMWEDRSWAIGGSMSEVKRGADIEQSWVLGVDRRRYAANDVVPYAVEVTRYGSRVLTFDGELDGNARIEPPEMNGFFIGGGEAPVRALSLDRVEFGAPLHGTGSLRVVTAPDESLEPREGSRWSPEALGDLTVTGAVWHEIQFIRTYGEDLGEPLEEAE